MKEESLYDLIKLTLLGSELTYAVSLMRELGRRELLGDDSKAALQLPMNAKEFQRIIKAHPDLAAVFEGQNEDFALQFSAIDHAVERNTIPNNTSNTPSSHTRRFEKDTRGSMRIFQEEVGTANDNNDGHTLTDATSDELIQGSEIVYFKDQAELGYREQTEMVFAISVDSIEKRVNVVFRGSRTSADWAANKKFNGKAVPNPVKELDAFANDTTLPDEVYIHEGFYNYLHQGEGSDVGVFDNLLPILNKHPTYGLNVTGHRKVRVCVVLLCVIMVCSI